MKYSTITHPAPGYIPQSDPLGEGQIQNDAGGFVFQISDWDTLDRFLTIGAERGTYYATQRKQVERSFESLKRCLAADFHRTIQRIREVSVKGLAVKQDHAIFALAYAAASEDAETRQLALAQVSSVCRTGTTLFQFLEELKTMRNLSGRSVRRTIGQWYTEKETDKLAYQLVKYRQRNGWTHRDTLRLAHIKPIQNTELLHWAVKGGEANGIRLIEGFQKVQIAETAKGAAEIVREFDLPREAIPTQFLTDPEIWDALLPKMPLTAIIRNLGNMTKSGLLQTGSEASRLVCAKLENADHLRASRVHPISILIALKIYQKGKGEKGSGEWGPVPAIVATLDDAFYSAFGNVVPTGKRMLVGLDVSGSMSNCSPMPGLRAVEIGAALAMIWAATEPLCEVMGFADTFTPLGFHRKMSLSEATNLAYRTNFGRTDCALPIVWAAENKLDFDAFTVITDNETWFGKIHPKVALDQYRKERVPNAKQLILAMSAVDYSIADPQDPLAMDISGFSADVPQVAASFLSA